MLQGTDHSDCSCFGDRKSIAGRHSTCKADRMAQYVLLWWNGQSLDELAGPRTYCGDRRNGLQRRRVEEAGPDLREPAESLGYGCLRDIRRLMLQTGAREMRLGPAKTE